MHAFFISGCILYACAFGFALYGLHAMRQMRRNYEEAIMLKDKLIAIQKLELEMWRGRRVDVAGLRREI